MGKAQTTQRLQAKYSENGMSVAILYYILDQGKSGGD